MARMLSEGLGWTISDQPDPKALNYALPYLEIRDKHSLPMISLFSHLEDTVPVKAKIWEAQATRSLLRICWTPMYEENLAQYGPTVRINPPLDRDVFAPVPDVTKRNKYHPKLVVGVSGFVYGGGRKGEALVGGVSQSDVGQKFDWNAIGRGWPVPTRGLKWRQLATWYSSLDIYFCPSLVEGIPYGPLEALACGTPIIIPRHVGMMDDLPDMPGIVRYDVGDEESAKQALAELADSMESVRPDDLRAVTEPYTIEGWVSGHAEAIEELETTVELPQQYGDSPEALESKRGIYVVAYGEPARKCSVRLIESIRKYLPGIPVAVASDRPVEEADLFVPHPDSDLGGRIAKTKMYEMTPPAWEEILYLDADTELVADVSFLFDALSEGWELVLTKDQDDYDIIFHLWRRDSGEDELGRAALGSDRALQLAGGVMAFRRTAATEQFFSEWVREWDKLGRRDQGALIRALYANPVQMLVLGCHWNSFTGIFKGETAGILHHRGGPARRARGWRGGRLDDAAAMAAAGRPRRETYWGSGTPPARQSPLKKTIHDKRAAYWDRSQPAGSPYHARRNRN